MSAFVLSPGVRALSERTMLERAVVQALGPLRKQQGGYCEFVGEYAGELDDIQDEDDIADTLRGRVPAVLVSTGDDTYQLDVSKRRARIDLQFGLLLVSQHLRSHESRTQGDIVSYTNPKADPGVYQMLADARTLLMGRSLAVDGFGFPSPRLSRPRLRRPGFMAYSAVYQIDFRYEQGDYPPARQLESLEHRHNIAESEAGSPVAAGQVLVEEVA